MAELEVECMHNIEFGDSGYERTTKWTYTPFTIDLDIKEYGVYQNVCPSCGRKLFLTIFPGLPLSKALTVQFRALLKSWVWGFFFSSFLLFVLAIAFIPAFRNWFVEGAFGSIANVLLGIYILIGIGSWYAFFSDLIGAMRLKCLVNGFMDRGVKPGRGFYGHQVFYKGRNLTDSEEKELRQRVPYYESANLDSP